MMLTWREVQVYLHLLLRWWWVIALSVALSGGVALYIVRQQPALYVARISLMVGDSLTTAAPDNQVLGLSNTLALFYGEMARREPILKPVAEDLQLPFPWQLIADRMIVTNVNPRANLLEISITDTNPERAAIITSAIANQLISYSPHSSEEIAQQRVAIEAQMRDIERNLNIVDQKILELQNRKATLNAAADLRDIQDQLDELEKTQAGYQTTYNQLVGLRTNNVVNSLSVFEPVAVPTHPLPSRSGLTVAMAGAGGLLLALVAVMLLEYLDDRWRDGRDIKTRFGMAYLGAVPAGPPLIRSTPEQLIRREESVREAHTQILLAALEKGTRLLLVTSPRPSEARSAFTVDLAELFTRSGYRVLLVDADISKTYLTNLVGHSQATRPVVVHNGDVKLWSYLQPTELPNVMLLGRRIGSDGKPMTPSLPWPDLVQSLNRAADVIIFDGPSVLMSADAALLAPLVEGVVLTLDPVQDRRGAVMESKARLLRRRGANLLGAVILTHDSKSKHKRGKHPLRTNDTSLLLPEAGQGASAVVSEPELTRMAEQGGADMQPMITPPPERPIVTLPPTLDDDVSDIDGLKAREV